MDFHVTARPHDFEASARNRPSRGLGLPVVAALLLVCAIAVLIVVARTYLPFFSDDALISLRYSDRLLSGHGLTFSDGERVEGYSNLLWVLMVAAGGLVNADLIVVSRLLATVGMALAVIAAFRTVSLSSWSALVPAVAGAATLVLSQGIAIWAIGGLEQPLQLALLAWALVLLTRSVDSTPAQHLAIGGLLALLVLTRPDGALFTGAILLGLVAAEGLSRRALRCVGALVALPAAAWVGQLAFRLWYYDDWLPNTAYVKLSWSYYHLTEGLSYLWEAARMHAPVVLLAAVVLATARPFRRRATLVPLIAALAWAGYVASVGGDIFPGRRHFLPVLVCLAVMIGTLWRSSRLGRLPFVLQAGVLAIVFVPYAALQARDSENIRAREEVWEWECATLASTLRVAFEDAAPLIATDPVGCIAYFSRLPVLDMMGLNDRHIARARSRHFGQGWIGHELGDGRYVFSRAPDLVLLCTPEGSATGCFRSGVELVSMLEFPTRYQLVTVVPANARYPTLLWARTGSPKVGLRRTEDGVRIPALLFASGGRANAMLSRGRLVTRVPPGGAVRFDRLPSDVTAWRPQALASGTVSVVVEGTSVIVTAGSDGADLAEVLLTRPTA